MTGHPADAAALTWSRPLSIPAKPALIIGGAMIAAVLALNVPGNPVAELRHHRLAGMLLAHGGMFVLAVGMLPALRRALAEAAALTARGLVASAGAVIFSVAVLMLLLSAWWPDYAHQLLTREWGLVEPLHFVLYLMTARLCFAIAAAQPWRTRTSRARLYRLGGWGAILFALEEVDYLGVISLVVRQTGIADARARIGGSYVGAAHDILNVTVEYGLSWLPVLMLGIGAVAAAWWITRGKASAAREIVSWRFVPAVVGVLLMIVAQFKDVHDELLAGLITSKLLDDFLEEPLELLAILCLDLSLMVELLAFRQRSKGQITDRSQPTALGSPSESHRRDGRLRRSA
jgi:hypothetical protein